MNTTRMLRVIARVCSVGSLVIILAFATSGGGAPTPSEWVALAFFPVGVLLGLAMAWYHEGVGGAVAVGSLLAFYLWMTFVGRTPSGPYFFLIAAPGFLFLASWLIGRYLPRPEMDTAM
jgi:hypothetical protein